MARIKIQDLPKSEKISKSEMQKIRGGGLLSWLMEDSGDLPTLQRPEAGADSWPTFK